MNLCPFLLVIVLSPEHVHIADVDKDIGGISPFFFYDLTRFLEEKLMAGQTQKLRDFSRSAIFQRYGQTEPVKKSL